MQFIAVLELAISMTQSFIEQTFFELQSCADQFCAVNVMLQHISEQMSMREAGRELHFSLIEKSHRNHHQRQHRHPKLMLFIWLFLD